MKIDITKTPLENLILQIKEDNPAVRMTAADVTHNGPAIWWGLPPQNTQTVLTAVPGTGYVGTRIVSWTRTDMDSGVAVPVTTLEVLSTDDQAAVETKVATALGLMQSELEFSAYTAAVDDQTPGTITVAPLASSLLYLGAAKVVEITVPVDVPEDLETSITQDELNGFDPEV